VRAVVVRDFLLRVPSRAVVGEYIGRTQKATSTWRDTRFIPRFTDHDGIAANCHAEAKSKLVRNTESYRFRSAQQLICQPPVHAAACVHVGRSLIGIDAETVSISDD